jgi:hypothetical protein
MSKRIEARNFCSILNRPFGVGLVGFVESVDPALQRLERFGRFLSDTPLIGVLVDLLIGEASGKDRKRGKECLPVLGEPRERAERDHRDDDNENQSLIRPEIGGEPSHPQSSLRHQGRSPQTGLLRRLTRPCSRFPFASTYLTMASQACFTHPALRSGAIDVPHTLAGPR